MAAIEIRAVRDQDRAGLRRAMVELQEHERALHDSRRPAETMVDAYLDWLLSEAASHQGAVFVATSDAAFAGFLACWVAVQESIAETPDSCRYGYISDICVLPPYRRLGIAQRFLAAAERHLAACGVTRLRLSALAANRGACATYETTGFERYELVFEKRIARGR